MEATASMVAVAKYAELHRETLWAPGVSVGLTDRDRSLGVVVDGWARLEDTVPVDERHRFQIGSISKGFTALAVLRQVDAGRIDLDAPVTTYLPWFEVRSTFTPITVHHLLSHTSGIVSGTDFTSGEAAEVWALRDTLVGFSPGTRFRYSNVGYKTLGLILSAVTGEPWWETVHRDVMNPIGMGDADVVISRPSRERLAVGYSPPYDDRPWLARHGWVPAPWFDSATADGTICASAEELTTYARCLLRRCEGIVSSASFDKMTTPVASPPAAPGEHFGYGVKWIEDEGRRLLGHGGGMVGYSAYLLVDPNAGVGAVALMNSPYGDTARLARFALDCVAAEVEGRDVPAVPAARSPHDVDGAEAFAGVYRDDAGVLEVVAEGDRLFVVVERATAERKRAPLEPVGEDAFGIDDPDLELDPISFVREDGKPSSAFWGSRRLDAAGARVRSPEAAPPTADAVVGCYVSWNPWAPRFSVFLRRNELWLCFVGETIDGGGDLRLTPLPDGSFRAGDEWSPDRVRFDMLVDGRAQRAVFDAAPYYRTALG